MLELENMGEEEKRSISRSFLQSSRINIKDGEFRRAVDDCSTALAFDREDMPAHMNRAVAYLLLGKYQNAMLDAGMVMLSDPDSKDIRKFMALAATVMKSAQENELPVSVKEQVERFTGVLQQAAPEEKTQEALRTAGKIIEDSIRKIVATVGLGPEFARMPKSWSMGDIGGSIAAYNPFTQSFILDARNFYLVSTGRGAVQAFGPHDVIMHECVHEIMHMGHSVLEEDRRLGMRMITSRLGEALSTIVPLAVLDKSHSEIMAVADEQVAALEVNRDPGKRMEAVLRHDNYLQEFKDQSANEGYALGALALIGMQSIGMSRKEQLETLREVMTTNNFYEALQALESYAFIGANSYIKETGNMITYYSLEQEVNFLNEAAGREVVHLDRFKGAAKPGALSMQETLMYPVIDVKSGVAEAVVEGKSMVRFDRNTGRFEPIGDYGTNNPLIAADLEINSRLVSQSMKPEDYSDAMKDLWASAPKESLKEILVAHELCLTLKQHEDNITSWESREIKL